MRGGYGSRSASTGSVTRGCDVVMKPRGHLGVGSRAPDQAARAEGQDDKYSLWVAVWPATGGPDADRPVPAFRHNTAAQQTYIGSEST